MSKHPQFTVSIDRVDIAGMGIGQYEGRMVEVGGCLPGDVAQVQVFGKKKGVLRARVLSILTPSPLRQKGHCTVAGVCGGCRFPDVAYLDQLRIKQEALDSFLGVFAKKQRSGIIPALETQFHRNKMDYIFGTDGPVLGLKKRGDFRTVVPVTDCQLLDPVANEILTFTCNFFAENSMPVWHPDADPATPQLRYLTLRQSKTTGKFLVVLIVSAIQSEMLSWAKAVYKKFPISGVLAGIHAGPADTSVPTSYHPFVGDPYLEETLLNTTFRLSPGAFFQTNTRQAEILYREVLRTGKFSAEQHVWDLYSGTGTIGLLIAPHVREVIGVEEHPGAIQDAENNAKANQISNIRFIQGRVRQVLKTENLGADSIVIDPPRSGLEPKVISRIAACRPSRIVYVSCQPTTWKRDVHMFADHGYTLLELQAVDMFPHTPHLELVSVLGPVGFPEITI